MDQEPDDRMTLGDWLLGVVVIAPVVTVLAAIVFPEAVPSGRLWVIGVSVPSVALVGWWILRAKRDG